MQFYTDFIIIVRPIMNMTKYAIFVLAMLLFGTAQANQIESSGFWLDHSVMTKMKLAKAGDIPNILFHFEYYDGAVPSAFEYDFNGDGIVDILIESAISLCGNGGCMYVLVDGRSKKQIGTFFGKPLLILDQKINGYPVIQSYSHMSVESGNFTTYVFDGQKYTMVSSVYLIGESVKVIFDKISQYRDPPLVKTKKR